MMVKLPTHICVTRSQWVNSKQLGSELYVTNTDAYHGYDMKYVSISNSQNETNYLEMEYRLFFIKYHTSVYLFYIYKLFVRCQAVRLKNKSISEFSGTIITNWNADQACVSNFSWDIT